MQINLSFSFLFFLAVVMPCFDVLAQEDTIKGIDNIFRQVVDNIEREEYHLNEYKINAGRYSLHQPGYFQHIEKFFYTFDLRNEDKKPLLKAVVLKTEREEIHYNTKFIFDNQGNLVYYLEEQNDATRIPYNKLSVYIHSGKAIKWLEDESDMTTKAEGHKKRESQIINEAKACQKKFEEQLKELNSK